MYVINIHGILANKEDEPNEKTVSVNDVAMQLVNAHNDTELMLDFASDGGYDDVEEAIEALLKNSGKILHSRNSGNVASAATKLFCLAPLHNRHFNPAIGIFLIHNPWGGCEGDSKEFAEYSKVLAAVEKKYSKFYAEVTGVDESILKTFMDSNVALTPEQITTLRLANIVSSLPIKAFAKLKSNIKMNDEIKKELTGFAAVIAKLTDAVGKIGRTKVLMIVDGTGAELNFPDISDENEISVGTTINIGASPATGSYVMPSGKTIVAENGKVTEIIEADASSAEMAALKAENETLKSQIAETQAKISENETLIADVKAQLKTANEYMSKIKAKFSDGKPATGATPPTSVTPETKKFSIKRK